MTTFTPKSIEGILVSTVGANELGRVHGCRLTLGSRLRKLDPARFVQESPSLRLDVRRLSAAYCRPVSRRLASLRTTCKASLGETRLRKIPLS